MPQSFQSVIKSFFIFGVPVLLSIVVAFELGYFNMATKPSNHNLNGTPTPNLKPIMAS